MMVADYIIEVSFIVHSLGWIFTENPKVMNIINDVVTATLPLQQCHGGTLLKSTSSWTSH